MLSLSLLYKKFIDPPTDDYIIENFSEEYNIFLSDCRKTKKSISKKIARNQFIRKKTIELFPEEWNFFHSYVKNKYESGVGLKLLARDIEITYTKMRILMKYMNISLRTGRSCVTEHLKKVRSENAIKMGGWKHRNTKNKKTERGVQGYFFNKSKNKYVWLRSTYEMILAKWLDENNFIWDVECRQWVVKGESYKPDFFIFDNEVLVKIIEVKGYYKNRSWKFEELKKEKSLQDVEFSLIEDITPFLDRTTYLKELKWWKKNRLLEQKL